MSKSVKRLIDQFVPENYNLSILLDPEAMKFSGKVIVTGKKIGRPSKRLTFHQSEIKITSGKITHQSKNGIKEIEIARVNQHNSLQEVRLHSDELIYPGHYTVEMDFEAFINDNMNGLYPCYFKHDGQDKKLLATQFESHHARQVFPCIDEPTAKATFDLAVTAPKIGTVISNMPAKSTKDIGNNLQLTKFDTTPIMSTYLLAFVWGEIHNVESQTKNGVVVRTWGTVAQDKSSLKYALNEAVKIQEYFEEYFDTPFPLPKCDHIALPDFDAGAMENWGLITYRESALLTDAKNRSVPGEQYVSLVIAHELSHQWFGNLVTMKWWDDLWLNESFASIMEHIPHNALHPDWYQWETYANYDILSASNRDIYSDVQNVGVSVNHPDEIRSLFDGAIVYAKGGRLVKMMREYVGDDVLRQALKNYFKKHAYSNASRDDLWQAVSEVSGKDIGKILGPWISQSGMPILTVDKTEQNDQRTIHQKRFIFDKDNDHQLWPVPLLPLNTVEPDVLFKKDNQITILDPKKPLLLNKNGSGHYIVKYNNHDDYSQIINLLKEQEIESESRINILNDHLLMARHGDINLVDVLNIVKEMENEPREAVWAMISRTIGFASTLGENDKTIEEGLKKLRYNLAHSSYKKLGWIDKPEDDPNITKLRATMIGFMLASKDKPTIDFVLDYYKQTDLDKIPADRRSAVFATVVKHGKDKDEINKLIDLYKNSQNPDLLQDISVGLCSTEDPKIGERLLAEGLSKDGFVKPQDYFRWFAYLYRNKYTRDITWEWLTAEWDRLLEMFSDGINIDFFVSLPASSTHTKEDQARFIKFYKPKTSIVRISRDIKVAISEIEARVAWRDRDLKLLQQFFK